MRPLLILSLSLLFFHTAFGQKKVSGALGKFIQTEFMTTYMTMKIEAENAVKTFQMNQERYQVQDVGRVRSEYDKIAVQFNALLEGIKNDFLNKKKLKYIGKFPESYSDGLQMKLYKLSDQYAKGFQQALADATQNEIDGSAILLLITEIIGLSKGMSDYFSKLRREARQYNQAYLYKHLVNPHRWKSWSELAGGRIAPNYQQPDATFDPSSVPLRIPNSSRYNNGNFNDNSFDNNDFDNGQFDNGQFDNPTDPYNPDNINNDPYNNDPYNNSSEDPMNNYNEDPTEDPNTDWNNTARSSDPDMLQNQSEQNSNLNSGNTNDPFLYGEWNTGPTDSLPTQKNNRQIQRNNFKKERQR
ncbi:MAG: hypothetical protein AAF990_22990 [Bacteroidota bacterium]